jgi:hypothetical protein
MPADVFFSTLFQKHFPFCFQKAFRLIKPRLSACPKWPFVFNWRPILEGKEYEICAELAEGICGF